MLHRHRAGELYTNSLKPVEVFHSRPLRNPATNARKLSQPAMLSMPHLIVLFVVALVIFGPQKLPELARMLGKATAEFRKMTRHFPYAPQHEPPELHRQPPRR